MASWSPSEIQKQIQMQMQRQGSVQGYQGNQVNQQQGNQSKATPTVGRQGNQPTPTPNNNSNLTATSFEQEAIEASNLYTTALSIKDRASPDSLAKVVKKQHTDLEKEKRILEKELKEIRHKTSSFDRDFLDTVPVADSTTASAASITLQDTALSIFIFCWCLFCLLLIAFSFMPPAGDIKRGLTVFGGLLVATLTIWSLIYYYA